MTKDSKDFHVSRMALLAIAMMSTSMGTAMAAPNADNMNAVQPTSVVAMAQQEKVSCRSSFSYRGLFGYRVFARRIFWTNANHRNL